MRPKTRKITPRAMPAIWSELKDELAKGSGAVGGVGATIVGVEDDIVAGVGFVLAAVEPPGVSGVVGLVVPVLAVGSVNVAAEVAPVGEAVPLPAPPPVAVPVSVAVPDSLPVPVEVGGKDVAVGLVAGALVAPLEVGVDDPGEPVANTVVVVKTVVVALGATVMVAKIVSNLVLVMVTPIVIVVVTSIVTVSVVVDVASPCCLRTTFTPKTESCASSGSYAEMG